MSDFNKTIDFIIVSNWIVLITMCIIAYLFFSVKVFFGIVFGGLIVTINFHLLKKTLKKVFNSDSIAVKNASIIGSVLGKYYLRFGLSAIVIFFLISQNIVHPLGLLSGLSIVVASIFITAAVEIKKIVFKETI